MDIAALSMAKSLGQLQQQASLAVMKKAMDAAEQSGSLVQQMLDKAAEGRAAAQANLSHVGNNVDEYA